MQPAICLRGRRPSSSSLPSSWNLLFLASLVAGLCLPSRIAPAQTSDVTSSISGTVNDASGAAVAGAAVEAVARDTGFLRTTQTRVDGSFTLALLTVGQYNLSVSSPSFARFQQNGLDVRLGYATPVRVTLQPGADTQTVTVEANANILNTETFDISDGLNQRSIENMPITSRNTFNLALLVPGLNGTRDDEFGNPTFAFGGMQRKAFLIDGIDNTQRGGPGRLGIVLSRGRERGPRHRRRHGTRNTVAPWAGIINFITRGGTNGSPR